MATFESKAQWSKWISSNINSERLTIADYGLSQIAREFNKEEALQLYWQGSDKENAGDIQGGISLYKKAFRMWPALDSVTMGGLPAEVRKQAQEHKDGLFDSILLDCVSVPVARASTVMHSPALLTPEDILDVERTRSIVLAKEGGFLQNNSENGGHHNKQGVFLHNPPQCSICSEAPNVLGKMLQFASEAWEEAGWTGTIDKPGPLYNHAQKGGLASLNIRCVEMWEYSPGGGLVDDYHNDTDSTITLVCLMSEASEFAGGSFRTFESDGTHQVHTMQKGDAICFLSHKFHNIVPLARGTRKSLVIELWQGGVGHHGR
jgi:hypothetical protein